MTNERINQITKALLENESEVVALFELTPAEASAKLAQKGYDFTEAELVEYGKILDEQKKAAEANTELAEDALDQVAGGVIGYFVAGVLVGYWVYGQKW